MGNKRGQIAWDQLIPWIIGLGVLALAFVLYFILTGKANSIIDYFKNLARLR